MIQNIRYLTMSAEDFVKYVVPSELLSAEDKLAFLTHLVTDQSVLQLPKSFCLQGERRMEKQDKFIEEFRRLIGDDIATDQPAPCQDCEQFYSGFYIDHLLFVCPNTSCIDRTKLIYQLFGCKAKEGGVTFELEQNQFDSNKLYQMALCRYVRHNFNWIQLNGKTYEFDV